MLQALSRDRPGARFPLTICWWIFNSRGILEWVIIGKSDHTYFDTQFQAHTPLNTFRAFLTSWLTTWIQQKRATFLLRLLPSISEGPFIRAARDSTFRSVNRFKKPWEKNKNQTKASEFSCYPWIFLHRYQTGLARILTFLYTENPATSHFAQLLSTFN